jgi:hypothetical protein
MKQRSSRRNRQLSAGRKVSIPRLVGVVAVVAGTGVGLVSLGQRVVSTFVDGPAVTFSPYVDLTLDEANHFEDPLENQADEVTLGFVVADPADCVHPLLGHVLQPRRRRTGARPGSTGRAVPGAGRRRRGVVRRAGQRRTGDRLQRRRGVGRRLPGGDRPLLAHHSRLRHRRGGAVGSRRQRSPREGDRRGPTAVGPTARRVGDAPRRTDRDQRRRGASSSTTRSAPGSSWPG